MPKPPEKFRGLWRKGQQVFQSLFGCYDRLSRLPHGSPVTDSLIGERVFSIFFCLKGGSPGWCFIRLDTFPHFRKGGNRLILYFVDSYLNYLIGYGPFFQSDNREFLPFLEFLPSCLPFFPQPTLTVNCLDLNYCTSTA
jgi:hypothetical protein